MMKILKVLMFFNSCDKYDVKMVDAMMRTWNIEEKKD